MGRAENEGLERLRRLHLVQEPFAERYALHAVVRHAVRKRTLDAMGTNEIRLAPSLITWRSSSAPPSGSIWSRRTSSPPWISLTPARALVSRCASIAYSRPSAPLASDPGIGGRAVP